MSRATRSSSRADSTSSGLLRDARRNDSDAWRELAKCYGPLIRHWCRSASLDDTAADDVVQSVLLQLTQSLPRFKDDGRKASFRRWLHSITASRIVDYQRAERRNPPGVGGTTAIRRLLDVSAAKQNGEDVELSSSVQRIETLLASVRRDFAEETWQAFWLTTVENQTSVEAAARLKLTPNAVRLAKARVLKRLREADAGFAEESE